MAGGCPRALECVILTGGDALKGQAKLALFVLIAVAAAEGARHILAQSVNPSQTTAPQNPSQTTAPQNPSQAVPPQNPSQAIPPRSPAPAAPPRNPSATAPEVPRPTGPAAPVMSDRQLAFEVRSAIVMSGASVKDLRIRILAGKVILSGVVGSEEEKARVGARAAGVAGEQNVVNELTVR